MTYQNLQFIAENNKVNNPHAHKQSQSEQYNVSEVNRVVIINKLMTLIHKYTKQLKIIGQV